MHEGVARDDEIERFVRRLRDHVHHNELAARVAKSFAVEFDQSAHDICTHIFNVCTIQMILIWCFNGSKTRVDLAH